MDSKLLMILCGVNEILVTSLVFTYYAGINAIRESPYSDDIFLNNDVSWIKCHISKDVHPYYEVYIMLALKNLKAYIIYCTESDFCSIPYSIFFRMNLYPLNLVLCSLCLMAIRL
jgi:hypothetical protein